MKKVAGSLFLITCMTSCSGDKSSDPPTSFDIQEAQQLCYNKGLTWNDPTQDCGDPATLEDKVNDEANLFSCQGYKEIPNRGLWCDLDTDRAVLKTFETTRKITLKYEYAAFSYSDTEPLLFVTNEAIYLPLKRRFERNQDPIVSEITLVGKELRVVDIGQSEDTKGYLLWSKSIFKVHDIIDEDVE